MRLISIQNISEMEKVFNLFRNVCRKQYQIGRVVLSKMFPFVEIKKFNKYKSVFIFTGQKRQDQKDPDFWRYRAYFWSMWFVAILIPTVGPEFTDIGGFFYSEKKMDHPDSIKLIEDEIYRIHLTNVKNMKNGTEAICTEHFS